MPKHSNSAEYAQIKTATIISKLTNNLLLFPNQLIKYFDHYLNKKWQNHLIRWCDYYLNKKNAETILADGQIIIWIKKIPKPVHKVLRLLLIVFQYEADPLNKLLLTKQALQGF